MYRIKNLLFICRIHSDHCPSVINVHLFIQQMISQALPMCQVTLGPGDKMTSNQ